MRRFLLILVAFSVLNESIDLDYLTASSRPVKSANYDDIDSITEYLIEEIMDDDNCIPEGDDDHKDAPDNNGVEKFSWNPLYCQLAYKVIITPSNTTDPSLQAAFQQAYPTCKGYLNIVSPPPDMWAA